LDVELADILFQPLVEQGAKEIPPKKHGVEYNAMAVVNDYNVDYPLEFYNFFKELDCRYWM